MIPPGIFYLQPLQGGAGTERGMIRTECDPPGSLLKLGPALQRARGEGDIPQLSYESLVKMGDLDLLLASHQIEAVSYYLLLALIFGNPGLRSVHYHRIAMKRRDHRSGKNLGVVPASYKYRRRRASIYLRSHLSGWDVHAGGQLLQIGFLALDHNTFACTLQLKDKPCGAKVMPYPSFHRALING